MKNMNKEEINLFPSGPGDASAGKSPSCCFDQDRTD